MSIRVFQASSENNPVLYATVHIPNPKRITTICDKVGRLYAEMFLDSDIKPELYHRAFGWAVIDSIPGVEVSLHDSLKEAIKAGFEAIVDPLGWRRDTTADSLGRDYGYGLQDWGLNFAVRDAFGEKVSFGILENSLSPLPEWKVYSESYKDSDHDEVIAYVNNFIMKNNPTKRFNQEHFNELVKNSLKSIG